MSIRAIPKRLREPVFSVQDLETMLHEHHNNMDGDVPYIVDRIISDISSGDIISGRQMIEGYLYPWIISQDIREEYDYEYLVRTTGMMIAPQRIFSESCNECRECLGEYGYAIIGMSALDTVYPDRHNWHCIQDAYDEIEIGRFPFANHDLPTMYIMPLRPYAKLYPSLATDRYTEFYRMPSDRSMKDLFGIRCMQELLHEAARCLIYRPYVPTPHFFDGMRNHLGRICPDICGSEWQDISSDNFSAQYKILGEGRYRTMWIRGTMHSYNEEKLYGIEMPEMDIELAVAPEYYKEITCIRLTDIHPNIDSQAPRHNVCVQHRRQIVKMVHDEQYEAAAIILMHSLCMPNAGDAYDIFQRHHQILLCGICDEPVISNDMCRCQDCGAILCRDCVRIYDGRPFCPSCFDYHAYRVSDDNNSSISW